MCQHPSCPKHILGHVRYPLNAQSPFTAPVTPDLPSLCPVQEITDTLNPTKIGDANCPSPVLTRPFVTPLLPPRGGGQGQCLDTVLAFQRVFQAHKPRLPQQALPLGNSNHSTRLRVLYWFYKCLKG